MSYVIAAPEMLVAAAAEVAGIPATSSDTTIPLASVSGQAPGTVAISPITGDVYVTNFTDETLSVIS